MRLFLSVLSFLTTTEFALDLPFYSPFLLPLLPLILLFPSSNPQHNTSYPKNLLMKFFALHRFRAPGQPETFLIIANNLLHVAPPNVIHTVWDLKGSLSFSLFLPLLKKKEKNFNNNCFLIFFFFFSQEESQSQAKSPQLTKKMVKF